MDYPCGKFGDCSFSHFGSIVQINRHTHTDADERYTPATVVGVSKDDDDDDDEFKRVNNKINVLVTQRCRVIKVFNRYANSI